MLKNSKRVYEEQVWVSKVFDTDTSHILKCPCNIAEQRHRYIYKSSDKTPYPWQRKQDKLEEMNQAMWNVKLDKLCNATFTYMHGFTQIVIECLPKSSLYGVPTHSKIWDEKEIQYSLFIFSTTMFFFFFVCVCVARKVYIPADLQHCCQGDLIF